MWTAAELVLVHYKPLSLEKGMLFVNKVHHGSIKEQIEIFALDKLPIDEEEFLQKNGYPVHLNIIDEMDNVIAEHEEIGWWDEGDDTDELYDVSLYHINNVLNNFDALLEIEGEMYSIDDGEAVDDEMFTPNYLENKVVLRYLQEEEEIDEEEDDEEEEETVYCPQCNGSGEGMYDGSRCWLCKGSGEYY